MNKMKTDKKVRPSRVLTIYPFCQKCINKCKARGLGELIDCVRFIKSKKDKGVIVCQ